MADLIRIRSPYAFGDIVVLTGAVRDLQRAYPGRFLLSIESGSADVWRHNPHVVPFSSHDLLIDCVEAKIDRTGAKRHHYTQSYLDLLNEKLGTDARLSAPGGDIHLSQQERSWESDVTTLCGQEIPFWLVCSGGKCDLPIKWWDHRRYQEVVTALRGKIQFVQVGNWGSNHPRLEGAIDLRGKTDVRDLIHLVHHAEGVFCGVTALMHLAAAVPGQGDIPRPAVIIGGSREPQSWEAYPGHTYLTPGVDLECAPCWKADFRSKPGARDQDCAEISGGLPRCMDLITAERVIEAFLDLQKEGRIRFLSARLRRPAALAVHKSQAANIYDQHNLTPQNAVARATEFIASIRAFPARRFAGRGIVICGGGTGYFTQAWINLKLLRQLGCTLPVELWYLGRHELDRNMERLMAPLGVRCVNARERMGRYPMRNPLGWELKSYALLHSRFREVLFLDADNVAVRDPSFLFDTPEFQRFGAIFWPDFHRFGSRQPIWKLCGVRYRNEPEFESGQMVIDKERCWKALQLAWWYNDHSEFYYRYIHGDKDTFHLAWRRMELPYAMPGFPIHRLKGVMCQHDFDGQILFQHRNMAKWSFFGQNPRVAGFRYEEDCLRHLEELRERWDGRIGGAREVHKEHGFRFRVQTYDQGVFESVVACNEYDLPPAFAAEDRIIDIGGHIGSFARACYERGSRSIVSFEPHPENAALARKNLADYAGVKLVEAAVLHERATVEAGPFGLDIGCENTGGVSVQPLAKTKRGGIRAVSLDDWLRKFGAVALVKFDCEGSEWPILLQAREWQRVGAVCGEYHLAERNPFCPPIKGGFTRALLVKVLREKFRYVRTEPDRGNPALGKFWASRVKGFFGAQGSRSNATSREDADGARPKAGPGPGR